MKTFAVSILVLGALVLSSSAVTLADVAGVYRGWRTQSIQGYPTMRFAETDTIYLDGTIVQEVTLEDGTFYTLTTTISFDEAGHFAYPDSEGDLGLHGVHLNVRVHFFETILGVEADVHFSANRVPKLNR